MWGDYRTTAGFTAAIDGTLTCSVMRDGLTAALMQIVQFLRET